MRTLSDITYEPHRLIVALALVWLLAGVLAGRVVRTWIGALDCALVALVPGALLYRYLHPHGDIALDGLAAATAALAVFAGASVVNGSARRIPGLIAPAPLLVLAPLLWSADLTPPISAHGAAIAYERQYGATHYRCVRTYDAGESSGISRLEFACEPDRSAAYCAAHVCGPPVWFGVDERGRIDDDDLLPGGP